MLKLLSKLGLTGSAVTGIIFVDITPITSPLSRQNEAELEKIKKVTKTIGNIEDIELFEKINGCTFGFVGAWDEKKVWKVREFLKRHTNDEWKNKIITSAERTKSLCKKRKQIALFSNQRNGFVVDRNRFLKEK